MVTRIFMNPVAGIWTQSSPFGETAGRAFPHQGDDLACKVGTPIIASASGTVVYAGISGAYGNLVEINHADQAQTRYGHLSKINVHVGEQVTQGEQIGLSGGSRGAFGSGDSSGPHLHFEIRLAGKPVNPAPLIGGYGAQTDNPSQTGVNAPTTGIGAFADSFAKIGTNLTDPKFWTRTGVFVLGAVLLLIAVTKIFAMTDVGQSAIQSTKNALKTAAIVAP